MALLDKKSKAIQQCRLNIEAVIAYHGLPKIVVVAALPDRVMATAPSSFEPAVGAIFDRWDLVADHGVTADYGFRENCATCSMQLVHHKTGIWEADIDFCNPNYGLAPLIGHGVEVLWNAITKRKTDAFAVRRGLLKRGIPVEEAA